MQAVQNVTREIRTIRAQFNVPPGLKIAAVLSAKNEADLAVVKAYEGYIKLMAKIENLDIGINLAKPKQTATAVADNIAIYVPLTGLIDFEKEKKRLEKDLAIAKANIAVRNFPLSVADLRKKLKLKDGGDTYIFATTLADSRHVLIITKKAPAQ